MFSFARSLSKPLLLCVVCLVVTGGTVAMGFGQTGGGTTGLAFLRIGVGARAAGLGEAYTALATDATATYWNPAGLAALPGSQIAFTHTEWLQDIRSEFLAFAFPAFGGHIGLSVNSTNVGGIERRVGPSDEPLGTIASHDLAFGVSYGRALGAGLRAGLTVKYLYEKIYVESTSGVAFDLGLSLQPFGEGLTLAAVLQNLGSMNALRQESVELPSTVRVGFAYHLALPAVTGGLTLAADAVKVKARDLRGHFGAELEVLQYLGFRIGYQTGAEETGVSGGVGVAYKRYRLDYGYMPFSSNLGNTHRISISVQL